LIDTGFSSRRTDLEKELESDIGMAEHRDMFWNRKANIVTKTIATLMLFALRVSKFNKFTPDLYIDEGFDFSEYGLDAKVLCLPGHSKGSIAILTTCGDMLSDTGKPAVNSIIDDPAAANASIEKLKGLKINAVYPGHGKPFTWEQFLKNSK
jgi:glyoxylase-like metal-dependent hydrolase (beta-lactamase superfamily II)